MVPIKYHCAEEEIAYGPACWMWDYLRRSGASGFLLPLSGGADSSSTAAIVGAMCQMVVGAVERGDQQVTESVFSLSECLTHEDVQHERFELKRTVVTLRT
eukprot:4577064-Pyramimonas_sp.AAC.1